jgi:hypothetical protein
VISALKLTLRTAGLATVLRRPGLRLTLRSRGFLIALGVRGVGGLETFAGAPLTNFAGVTLIRF